MMQTEKFTHYGTLSFPLSTPMPMDHDDSSNPPLTMQLCYVESLPPMDLMDLYNGRADATGNRIWMGALLFIEAMIRPLPQNGHMHRAKQ